MTTLFDALAAYRICAKAEGKSPKTIKWVTSSVIYFSNFLGDNPDIEAITANDLRRFTIGLQDTHKFSHHPFNKPQQAKLSPQSINTYCRAIGAFFGYLHCEGLIESNPMEKVKMPRVPQKIVPAFSEREIEKLLAQPDKRRDRGFRDYALLITFIDTGARLSELAGLKESDVDLEAGYLRVTGRGSKERYIPFGQKVAKALLKYRLKHRPQPLATDRFWLTVDGRPLDPGRIEKIVGEYCKKAGRKRGKTIEETTQWVVTVSADDEEAFRRVIRALVKKYRAPRTTYATLGSDERAGSNPASFPAAIGERARLPS